jgi:hypothetical protein
MKLAKHDVQEHWDRYHEMAESHALSEGVPLEPKSNGKTAQ